MRIMAWEPTGKWPSPRRKSKGRHLEYQIAVESRKEVPSQFTNSVESQMSSKWLKMTQITYLGGLFHGIKLSNPKSFWKVPILTFHFLGNLW